MFLYNFVFCCRASILFGYDIYRPYYKYLPIYLPTYLIYTLTIKFTNKNSIEMFRNAFIYFIFLLKNFYRSEVSAQKVSNPVDSTSASVTKMPVKRLKLIKKIDIDDTCSNDAFVFSTTQAKPSTSTTASTSGVK